MKNLSCGQTSPNGRSFPQVPAVVPVTNIRYVLTSIMAFPKILEPLQCKTVFNRYISNGRSNQKISKAEVIFFLNFASVRTPPTQSTGPSTQSTGPQTLFLTDITVTVAQIRKKMHF